LTATVKLSNVCVTIFKNNLLIYAVYILVEVINKKAVSFDAHALKRKAKKFDKFAETRLLCSVSKPF
jgi:hypothetical protein